MCSIGLDQPLMPSNWLLGWTQILRDPKCIQFGHETWYRNASQRLMFPSILLLWPQNSYFQEQRLWYDIVDGPRKYALSTGIKQGSAPHMIIFFEKLISAFVCLVVGVQLISWPFKQSDWSHSFTINSRFSSCLLDVRNQKSVNIDLVPYMYSLGCCVRHLSHG